MQWPMEKSTSVSECMLSAFLDGSNLSHGFNKINESVFELVIRAFKLE